MVEVVSAEPYGMQKGCDTDGSVDVFMRLVSVD